MKINTTRLHILLLAIGLAAGGTARAAPYMDSDCHALKLQDASGVPQSSKRHYWFSGTCNINAVLDTGPKVLRTVPAVAEGSWDGASKTCSETFHLLGSVYIDIYAASTGSSIFGSSSVNLGGFTISTGVVSSTFKCNEDPLVSSAACVLVQGTHSNLSGFDAFSNPAERQHRPMLKGKTTLAEATAVSKKHVNPVAGATWPTTPKATPVPTAKFGSGSPTVVAAPGNEPTLPPGAVRKSGGFVPGSSAKASTIKGEVPASSQVPAVQVNPGPSNMKSGFAKSPSSSSGSQVPAVQQGTQVNPGSPVAKSGSSGNPRDNLRGTIANSPTTKSTPSVKQGLTATPG